MHFEQLLQVQSVRGGTSAAIGLEFTLEWHHSKAEKNKIKKPKTGSEFLGANLGWALLTSQNREKGYLCCLQYLPGAVAITSFFTILLTIFKIFGCFVWLGGFFLTLIRWSKLDFREYSNLYIVAPLRSKCQSRGLCNNVKGKIILLSTDL